MRKAVLLYNERSGGGRINRHPELQRGLQLLRDAGVEASLKVTESREDASEQARRAVLDGADAVLACGGDGTIHDVLQGVAGTRVALGVVPIGTANALAHDLKLPLDPVRAIRATLDAKHKRVALGLVEFTDFEGRRQKRYFTVAVGIGVDAHLFYKLHHGAKQRLGMGAYYAKAWHLWFTYRMQYFSVRCGAASDEASPVLATEMLAVRIRNFGGVLRELAPGASLDRDDLRVVLCQTTSRLAYLAYVTRGLLGVNWSVRGVDLRHSQAVHCDYASQSVNGNAPKQENIYVEADGELIGTLPVQITMVADALTLLVPAKSD
jgi:YegS/Rv2252/BmrU family lipid kinase